MKGGPSCSHSGHEPATLAASRVSLHRTLLGGPPFMLIINQILRLSNTLYDFLPAQRKTACGHLGAYKHGSFQRFPPGMSHCPSELMIWIQRFLCFICGKTYCVLPFCFLRRIAISLPDLLGLTTSRLSWDTLMKNYDVSRNTLWRWRRTGKTILKFLPILFSTITHLSWQTLSLHFSLLQYPLFLSKSGPTIP